jgi:hypothetical protein
VAFCSPLPRESALTQAKWSILHAFDVADTRQASSKSEPGNTRGGVSMSGRHSDDFFSRSKRVLLETAILIVFTVFLIDFVWAKISPLVAKIIDALR